MQNFKINIWKKYILISDWMAGKLTSEERGYMVSGDYGDSG